MNSIFRKVLFALPAAFAVAWLTASAAVGETVSVGMGGNAYVLSGEGAKVSNAGLGVRGGTTAVSGVFFSLEKPQKDVLLSLKARGNAVLEVLCGNEKFRVRVDGEDYRTYPLGKADFSKAGYQRAEIRATGGGEAEISELRLDGVEGGTNFVRDFEPYWGRRGASVNIGYVVPQDCDVEYFYNEAFVPEGEDALGIYAMACGFAEGYFGMQVNSPTERRVLFSVWSPFDTDDPKSVPAGSRVVPVRKGEGVRIGEFGNEGAGGQSFLRYPWRAGTVYKFLVRVRPLEGGKSEYTGYFFAPEEGAWRLIASFVRPQTQTWVKRPYSFLENFSPEHGWRERRAVFSNQWARGKDGKWTELTSCLYACDETGNKKMRVDYAGGVSPDGKRFWLKNCGFFDGLVEPGKLFSRKASGRAPKIDFAALEKLGVPAEEAGKGI